MKRLLLAVLVLAMLVSVTSFSNAQSKMSVGVGADLLLPMGTFGDAYSIGFGGSGRFQYDFTPMLAGGVNVGYYTFTAKDVAGISVKPKFSGLPITVYGKYYFMPEAAKARVYGMAELGLFFWSSKVTLPSYTILGQTFGGGEESTTGSDFNLVPQVGVEFPIGKVTLDVAAQFDIIFTSNNSTSMVGLRAGVVFPI